MKRACGERWSGIGQIAKFSVLICTNDRHEFLRQALRALIDETTEKPDEVVIVNGGDARADQVVESFQGRPGVAVKRLKTVNQNLAASRNIGLPHCTGDLIGMTDDDAQVAPDWVTQMKRAHGEHPEAGAVGGLIQAVDTRTLASRLAEQVTFPSWQTPRYMRTLPTVNLSYKAEIVRQVGAQDERLWTGEDVDYNWRMIRLGFKVWYDPAIKVRHHHPQTVRELWLKQYYYGRGYYMLRSKWHDMYCIYPHRLTMLKDWLKLGNFLAYPLYEPILTAAKMERWSDKLAVVPVEFIGSFVARYGLIVEFFRQRQGVSAR